MSQFTPDELTQSSAIHGDFDHASLNYSGHQNMILRAESDSCQNCESPSTQTTLIVNKYGDEHEYKFCGDGCEGQYMRENKMSYDAEEDTILAQLYEIEDMENPSEEDLRNYRNLEIRYGELTRMDAEANAVIVSGSVDGEPAMFSYEKGTKDELGFTPGRITTGENVKELGYGYDVDSPELTFDRFQKGFKNYKNNVWRKHMRAEEEDVDEGSCLCGVDYGRYGNNAQPLFDGRCCNTCNTELVIPARISMMFGSEEDERVVCFICNLTPEETDGENGPMMSTLGGDACKTCAEEHGYSHPRDMIYMDAEEIEMQSLFDMMKKQATKFTGMTILFTGIAAVGGYLIGKNRG
jgi:hypothetical protein